MSVVRFGKSPIALLAVMIITAGLAACQTPASTTTPAETTPTATPPPYVPAENVTPPNPPTQPPSPTIREVPAPTENASAPIVTTSPPVTLATPTSPAQPVLPKLDTMYSDMRSTIPRITAVFRFDTTNDPGFYDITLVSGNDSFGTQEIEWYRAAKEVSLTWSITPGTPAFYQLMNNGLVSEIFQTQITYRKFMSLSTVPRTSPSDLETQIADQINKERVARGLSLLSWNGTIFTQVLPARLKALGEEGVITPPPTDQPYLEADYTSGTGVGEDAITIYQSWVVNANYSAVIYSPNARSFAIRTDEYDNHRFYAVALFSTK